MLPAAKITPTRAAAASLATRDFITHLLARLPRSPHRALSIEMRFGSKPRSLRWVKICFPARYFIVENVDYHCDKIPAAGVILEKTRCCPIPWSPGLRRYEIGSKLRALRVKKKLGLVQLGEQPACRPRCCRRSSGESCFRRCRRCSASRWCSASASNTFSSRARTARWWRSRERRIGCACRTGQSQRRRPISSKASILPSPIAKSMSFMQNFLARQSRQSHTSMPGRSSST